MRRFTKIALHTLDALTFWLRGVRNEPEHIKTGRRGEEAAYFYLQRVGYTIVARNWRGSGRRGEIDIVGWDGETLCFIEVKTRGERGLVPAEAAVDMAKRDELAGMARLYRKRIRSDTPHRFDIVNVYLGPPMEIELMKGAFSPR
jgi:putative endonuclease